MTKRNKKPSAEPKKAGVLVGRMTQIQLLPLWVPSVPRGVRSDVVLDAHRPWHILPCHSKAGLFLRVRGTLKVTCLLLPCHISIHDSPSNGCSHSLLTHHLVSQLHLCHLIHPTSPACHTTLMTRMHQVQAIHVSSSSGIPFDDTLAYRTYCEIKYAIERSSCQGGPLDPWSGIH